MTFRVLVAVVAWALQPEALAAEAAPLDAGALDESGRDAPYSWKRMMLVTSDPSTTRAAASVQDDRPEAPVEKPVRATAGDELEYRLEGAFIDQGAHVQLPWAEWRTQRAVVLNDVAEFGLILEPHLEQELKQLRDENPFKHEQALTALQQNPRLRRAMAKKRSELSKRQMTCDWRDLSLTYGGGAYYARVSSESRGPRDRNERLLRGTVCNTFTAGMWRRFDCRDSPFGSFNACAIRLDGMPLSLKSRLAGDLNHSVFVRWRWRGLGQPVSVRAPLFGTYISVVRLVIPGELALDFIDEEGNVLWTAR